MAYLSFNKTERWGLIGLLAILSLIIIIRICLPFFASVEPDSIRKQQLVDKWDNAKRKNVGSQSDTTTEYINYQPIAANSVLKEDLLFNFDPNTLDSQGFIKLGLKPKTASILLRWRSKGKRFRHKEELRKVYTLTNDDYLRLEPYIKIAADRMKTKLNLNTADSSSLIMLNGIGPKLAHRIIEYRKKNGPFKAYDQLYEVYRFPDSVYKELTNKTSIN